MPIDVIVPPLSQTMDTVVLAEWLRSVGEPVTKGEPLFRIETDKSVLDIESPGSGVLEQILVGPGVEVPVKSRVGVIALPDEAVDATAPPTAGLRKTLPAPPQPAAAGPLHLSAANEVRLQELRPERRSRLFASPRARRLAEQHGISLTDVAPTGPQRMIVERDIRARLEEKSTPVPSRQVTDLPYDHGLSAFGEPRTGKDSIEWVKLSQTRRTVARRLSESRAQTVAVTLAREVDATELIQLREQLLEEVSETSARLTDTDLLVSIAARQLRQHRYMNAVVDDGEELGLSDEIHVAIAVEVENGLLTPVLRNADRKRLIDVARERAELVRRAMAGELSPEELSGGTFTISNLGMSGVDVFTPIINPPQIAILGVGRIRLAPAVLNGEVRVRNLMWLSLTFDHRFVDGAPAARFLQAITETIEKPYLLL